MFIPLIISVLTLLIFYNFVWKRRNLPPGPIPLPLIGNVLTLKRLEPGYKAFEQWTKQYGPVFTFWLAEDPIVAVTDFSLMKEAFVTHGDATSGRDFFDKAFEATEYSKGNYAVVRGQGESWAQLRRFSLKVLRNLGMGKNVMEAKIMLEVNTMIETVDKDISENKESHFLRPLIDVAVGSIINQMTFGFRFIEETRKEFYELKALMAEHVHMFTEPYSSMVIAMPWLRYFPVFSHYFNLFKQRMGRFDRFFASQIEATIEKRKKENGVWKEDDTYLVDAFLHEMEQNTNKEEKDQYFNMNSLKGLAPDFFFAGQETTSNTLNFMVLYMMVFPEAQTKMQEELDRVIGDNQDGTKRIGLAERAKLPYTNAVINETQRFCNLLPINLIHKTTKDVEFGGFRIAKGTKIVPMISSVLYDEKIFTEPHKFMPERFIENGQLKKCEELIPFSLGKRQCLGESLARAELFLFTANLFYLYKMSTLNNEKPPTLDKLTGLTVSPVKYHCQVVKRTQHLFA